MTVTTNKRVLLGREVDFPDTGPWMHVKSGRHYVVLHPVMIESGLVPAVAYSALGGDGLIWVRPVAEFLDGRFV